MPVITLRRRYLARFGAALTVASALAIPLTGAPANAAAGTAGVPRSSRTDSLASVIANGVYRWQNANSGYCLVYAVDRRGAARQGSCDLGRDYTASWDVVNTNGDDYELINVHNGQCLTIPDLSKENAASPFVYTCRGTVDQIFTLVPATSTVFAGAYQIVNVNSGKCVEVGGAQTNPGAWVIQYTCSQEGKQMWRPLN